MKASENLKALQTVIAYRFRGHEIRDTDGCLYEVIFSPFHEVDDPTYDPDCDLFNFHRFQRSPALDSEKARHLIQTRFNELRIACKDGNWGALLEAMNLSESWCIPIPEWVGNGVQEIVRCTLLGESLSGMGRHSKWILRYQQDMIDLERAHTVFSCRENGIKAIDVYDVSSMILEGTFAKGSEDTIKKGFLRYKRTHTRSPGRYCILKCFRNHKKDKWFRRRHYMDDPSSTRELFTPEDWEIIEIYRVRK